MCNKIILFAKLCFHFLILMLCLGNMKVRAQDSQDKFVGYLKSIQSVLDNADLAYSYKVSVVNETTGKATDAVDGVLIKHGKSYLDSNPQFLTVSGNGYFMKAKLRDKVAYVYKLSALEKNTGLKIQDFANPTFSIPDSMIRKSGRFSLISETDILDFVYTVNPGNGQVQKFEFKLRKKDMAILDIIITAREQGSYIRVMHLFEFNQQVDTKKTNPEAYFKVSGSKVTMLNKLQSFKVNAFL